MCLWMFTNRSSGMRQKKRRFSLAIAVRCYSNALSARALAFELVKSTNEIIFPGEKRKYKHENKNSSCIHFHSMNLHQSFEICVCYKFSWKYNLRCVVLINKKQIKNIKCGFIWWCANTQSTSSFTFKIWCGGCA